MKLPALLTLPGKTQRAVAASAFALVSAFYTVPLLAATSQATPAAQVETFTLANGLEVIVIPNHRVPAVSHFIWYRIGAADDPPGKSGLAHYHEHMMYEGTYSHKAGEYADIIARHGGEENAFTGYDATSYYVSIAKSELPLAMELEADRMRGLNPTDAGSAKEKQVIIEERRMRIENNPGSLLSEQMNAALYRNHPYHWPVIGWMSEMEGLTKEDVLKFHRTYYHPNNAILIISGDITAAEVKPLAQKYYGNLPRIAVPPRYWHEEPPQNNERRLVMHHKNVRQPVFYRTYATHSLGYGKKEEALPLFVLSQVLGEGKTSRLYRSLVVEQKLATGIDTSYSGFNIGPGEFEITAVPEQGVDLPTLEKAINKELEKAIATPLTDTEFTRAKTQLKAESIFARDSLTSMARVMGWIRIVGLDKDYFTRWPDLIEAVTVKQVSEAAKDVLDLNHAVTGYLLPEDKLAPTEAKPAAPATAEPAKGGKP